MSSQRAHAGGGRVGAIVAASVLAGGVAAHLAGRPRVQWIGRLSRAVADLRVAESFYAGRLGFRPVARWSRRDPDFGRLLGVPGLAADAVLLALGDQRVQLLHYDPPGSPYPAAGADQPVFQHAALVVSDMDAAYARLCAAGPVHAISQDGPCTLPGGLRAYKFRDPDGHPLELLQFPAGQGRPAWHARTDRLFLGIDHSAITVADTAASLRFYRGLLGMRIANHSVNDPGPQQALDGIAQPLVRVTQLAPASPIGPRLELLQYLAPAARRPPFAGQANDIAKDRLVLHVRGIHGLYRRLLGAGTAFVSPGLVALDGTPAMTLRDPDGHDLLLLGDACSGAAASAVA